jgi:hypothetical protein
MFTPELSSNNQPGTLTGLEPAIKFPPVFVETEDMNKRIDTEAASCYC